MMDLIRMDITVFTKINMVITEMALIAMEFIKKQELNMIPMVMIRMALIKKVFIKKQKQDL